MNQINSFLMSCLIILCALTNSCVNDVDQKILPVLTTAEITVLKEATAKSGGNITSNGGSDIIQRGVCWSTSSNPTIADSITRDSTGIGVFSSIITKILPCTTYYVRAYATNSAGTAYGNEKSFTTTGIPMPINRPNIITFNPNLNYGTVTDIDGNVYKTITIGKYTWLAENLRVTRFRNGDPIPYLNDNSDWECYDFFVPGKIGLCDYQNTHNRDSIAKYGFLYTLRTIIDSRNIAPIGWHVADEWDTIIYDNTLTVCGIDWDSTTKDKSNVNNSGLTILPSGYRDNTGAFRNKNNCFQVSVGGAWAIIYPTFKYVAGSGQIYNHANAIQWGYSVRCVKDY